MNFSFPSADDFLINFGLEPKEQDLDQIAYCYSTTVSKQGIAIEFAFNVTSNFFRAIIRYNEKQLAELTSESVADISIYEEKGTRGLKVVFCAGNTREEARLQIEPEPKLDWHSLKG